MQGIERALIEWDLTRLVHSFCHYIDHGQYDELVALFTPDGVFDRIGQALNGREEIADAFRNRHAFLTRHSVTNLLFTRVEADEAEAKMYVANFVGQTANGELPVPYALPQPAILEFHDTYRKTVDGWRIACRKAFVVLKPDQTPGH